MVNPYPLTPLLAHWHLPAPLEAYLRAKIDPEAVSLYVRYRRLDAYKRYLPVLLYARCPLCGARCENALDTGVLPTNMLDYTILYNALPSLNYPRSICPHLVGTHEFFHLHGHVPEEVSHLQLDSGEVPLVTPWFLDKLDGCVVLHALPIGRVEQGRLVPAYTRFFLTYFSQNPRQTIEATYALQADSMARDDTYYPYTIASGYRVYHTGRELPVQDGWEGMNEKVRTYYEEKYDLQRWARAGKLGYLDYTSTDLPLRISHGLELPDLYGKLAGRRYHFFWSGGRFRTY